MSHALQLALYSSMTSKWALSKYQSSLPPENKIPGIPIVPRQSLIVLTIRAGMSGPQSQPPTQQPPPHLTLPTQPPRNVPSVSEGTIQLKSHPDRTLFPWLHSHSSCRFLADNSCLQKCSISGMKKIILMFRLTTVSAFL